MFEIFIAMVLTSPGPWFLDHDVSETFRTMPKEQQEKVHAMLVARGLCEPGERWQPGFFHGYMNVMRARATGQSNPRIDPNHDSPFQRQRRAEP